MIFIEFVYNEAKLDMMAARALSTCVLCLHSVFLNFLRLKLQFLNLSNAAKLHKFIGFENITPVLYYNTINVSDILNSFW